MSHHHHQPRSATNLFFSVVGAVAALVILFIIVCIVVPALISAKSTIAVVAGFALLALCVIVPGVYLWRLNGSHNKEGCCK